MEVKIEESWKAALSGEFEKPYFEQLMKKVDAAYSEKTIYPPTANIFQTFALCPFFKVTVVILGQDPYHGPEQAQGLAFSVPKGMKVPPSLQNIYKELKTDVGAEIPASGDLEHWTAQGILLLNSTLTVEKSLPASHQKFGWEHFTDAVIETISKEKEHVVFLLWGKFAQAKAELIDETKHLILKAPHPSPFSVHSGFFGCKHFSQTNTYLLKHSLSPIDW